MRITLVCAFLVFSPELPPFEDGIWIKHHKEISPFFMYALYAPRIPLPHRRPVHHPLFGVLLFSHVPLVSHLAATLIQKELLVIAASS